MTLWIENYSNKKDNAGYKVNDLQHAALLATASCQYGINNPCGILSENGKRYKFILKNDNGTIAANKVQIKKIASKLLNL